MESTVTAIEMRRKFGGILDRVAQKGDHITIMRGQRPLATLVPAQEHEERCLAQDRVKTVDAVLAAVDTWQARNPTKVKRMKGSTTTALIRRMRTSRWSSSTPR